MSFKDELLTTYRQMVDLKVSLGFSENTYSFYIEPFKNIVPIHFQMQPVSLKKC